MIKIGDKFKRLEVIGTLKKYNKTFFVTKCQCGKLCHHNKYDLTVKKTASCGCFRNELVTKRNTKHGGCGTKTYSIYKAMLTRCYNKNFHRYHRYGGRGITVCERWKKSFKNFLQDMGECPIGMSLDRINNNGNYTTSNCRWTDCLTQARNNGRTKLINIDGITKYVSDLAFELNVSGSTIRRWEKSGKLKSKILGALA